jgi:hypothetical protein
MTTKKIAINHLNVTQDITSQVQKILHEALESFDLSPTASDLALAMFDLSPVASDPALAMFDLSPIPVVEGHPSSF